MTDAAATDLEAIHPDRVKQARDRSLPPADTVDLAERFKLLSDPGRLRMIYALLGAGELCVRDLALTIDSSESATSHQLRQLRMGGLVRARKSGRTVYYRVADDHVRHLVDLAIAHFLEAK